MEEKPQKVETEKEPTNRQLGIVGAIGGFVSYYFFAAEFFQDLRTSGIAGPEPLIAIYLCCGSSTFGGFLGGVAVDAIAKAVNPKLTTLVKHLLYVISLIVGTIIGWLLWTNF